jgi:MoxR-like ATPase
MSEGELHVPRLGHVAAADGFRLVAAMNPFDAVGTARISGAVYDRVCRIDVGYQPAAEEVAIVTRTIPEVDDAWVGKVVALVRRTRDHPELRVGSSVRGALDATAVVSSLAALRGLPATDRGVGLDAVLVALSGRVRLREGAPRAAEEILTELYDEIFGPPAPGDAGGGDAEDGAGGGGPGMAPGKAHAPPGPRRA